MQSFIIRCSADLPPLKEVEYRKTASAVWIAAARAIKQFKKEVVGRKRVPDIKVKIIPVPNGGTEE